MDKVILDRCIQLYNLNGTVESVVWESDGTSVSISGVSEAMDVMPFIDTDRIKLPANEYPIYDTSQLKSLLGVLDDAVEIIVSEDSDNTPVSLSINDRPSGGSTNVKFMLSRRSLIPDAPSEPPSLSWDMTIKLDSEFTSKFIKAANALRGVETFTVSGNTFIIGYADIDTTKVSLEVNAEGAIDTHMNFSSARLRDIFSVNKDSEGEIKISSRGIMSVSFKHPVFNSRYYLPKVLEGS